MHFIGNIFIDRKIISDFSEQTDKFVKGFTCFKICIKPKGKQKQQEFLDTSFCDHSSDKFAELSSKKRNTKKRLKKVRAGLLSLFSKKWNRLFISGINKLIVNDRSKAVKLLRLSLERQHDNADASFLLALLTDQPAERLAAIKMAIQHQNNMGKLFKKYRIYLSYESFITADISLLICNDIKGFYLLAVEVLYDSGKIEDALELLENSNLLDESEISIFLGELYFEMGKYEDCIRVLQGIEGEDIAGSYALILLGKALRAINMLKAAADTFRKARRRSEYCPVSLILEGGYQLGLTMEKTGKHSIARKEYEKVLAVNYDYADIGKRLKELT